MIRPPDSPSLKATALARSRRLVLLVALLLGLWGLLAPIEATNAQGSKDAAIGDCRTTGNQVCDSQLRRECRRLDLDPCNRRSVRRARGSAWCSSSWRDGHTLQTRCFSSWRSPAEGIVRSPATGKP